MALPAPSLAAPAAQRLTHTQASPQQLTQALLFAQKELQDIFFPLSWATWVNALLIVQPELWVEQGLGQETVYLDAHALALLARHLAPRPKGRASEFIGHERPTGGGPQ